MTSSDLMLDESTQLQLTESEELTIQAEGYAITDRLGEGSYAKVYLAEYCAPGHSLKVKLACKVYDREKVPRDIALTFLPRELNILMRLEPSHPHIVHLHSIFQRRSKVFIFMGYVERGELLTHVQTHGPVSEVQARVWFRQLVSAVQYLHALNIAHRDVTCQNILISANQNIKLADFGFARLTRDDTGRQVMSETYCGSPAYAAPEVLRGKPYDPKMADIWSCGIVLYVMINKAMPFDDTNIRRLVKQQNNKKWKFRNSVRATLSAQVKSLVTQVMEPNCSKRLSLEEILACDWIAMNPWLVNLSEGESRALEAATRQGQQLTSVTLLDPAVGPVQASLGKRRSRGSFCSVVNVFNLETTSPHPGCDWPAQVASLGVVSEVPAKETATRKDRKRKDRSVDYLSNKMKKALCGDKEKKKRRVEDVETAEKECSNIAVNMSSDIRQPITQQLRSKQDIDHATEHSKSGQIVSHVHVTTKLSGHSKPEAREDVIKMEIVEECVASTATGELTVAANNAGSREAFNNVMKHNKSTTSTQHYQINTDERSR